MFKGDMNKKRAKALQKVKDAIALHGGQTILSTGITGDDARLATARAEPSCAGAGARTQRGE